MEGNTLRHRPAPQVIRAFATTRLADDLLARVYERLLTVSGQGSGGQDYLMERLLQELPRGVDQPITTGGR